jgi:hypothetical protein
MRRGAIQPATNLAKYWYEQAKQRGFVEAGHNLGRILYDEHEYESAFAEFLAGAITGFPPSMYRLATMYRNGEGAGKDNAEYERWLSASARGGHVFAKRDLMTLYITHNISIRRIISAIMIFVSLPFDLIRLKTMKNDNEIEKRIIC